VFTITRVLSSFTFILTATLPEYGEFLVDSKWHFTESPGWSMHMPQTPSKVTFTGLKGSRRKCIQPHLRMSPNICMMERTAQPSATGQQPASSFTGIYPVLLRPPPSPPSDHLLLRLFLQRHSATSSTPLCHAVSPPAPYIPPIHKFSAQAQPPPVAPQCHHHILNIWATSFSGVLKA